MVGHRGGFHGTSLLRRNLRLSELSGVPLGNTSCSYFRRGGACMRVWAGTNGRGEEGSTGICIPGPSPSWNDNNEPLRGRGSKRAARETDVSTGVSVLLTGVVLKVRPLDIIGQPLLIPAWIHARCGLCGRSRMRSIGKPGAEKKVKEAFRYVSARESPQPIRPCPRPTSACPCTPPISPTTGMVWNVSTPASQTRTLLFSGCPLPCEQVHQQTGHMKDEP